jgi:hypothetical protein
LQAPFQTQQPQHQSFEPADQVPYAQGPTAPQWGQAQYGPQDQNPYAQNAYPYAQQPSQNPYAQQQPYGQQPYGQNPYAQQPYLGTAGFTPAQAPKQSTGKRVAAITGTVLVVVVGVAVRVGLRSAFNHTSSSTPNVNISIPAIPTDLPSDLSSAAAGAGGGLSGADYAVGECMDLQGTDSATDKKVACTDSTANYKVLQVFPDVTGTISTDAQQCFSVSGNDDELDKTGADGTTVYLYCLGSTSDKHSPRRAQVGDCLDAPSSATDFFLVACSDSAANYVVLARYNGTNDTNKCNSVNGSTESFTLSNAPQVLLCGKQK